jgi:hypothetical protein
VGASAAKGTTKKRKKKVDFSSFLCPSFVSLLSPSFSLSLLSISLYLSLSLPFVFVVIYFILFFKETNKGKKKKNVFFFFFSHLTYSNQQKLDVHSLVQHVFA